MIKHVFDSDEHPAGRDQGASAQAVVTRPPESSTMLDRAVDALEWLAQQDECGVRELARTLAVSPSTAHGLLASLERLGLVQRTVDRRYRLGWRAATLGAALAHGFRPAELATDIVEALAERTGETAHLAMLDGTEVVYLAKVESPRAVRLASRTGQRFPAHATACGKALLAHDPAATAAVLTRGLERLTEHTITEESVLRDQLVAIRVGGLARDAQEIELDAACAAMPVPTRDGEPVRFALSVSGPRHRVEEALPVLRAALTAAVEALAARLYGEDQTRSTAA